MKCGLLGRKLGHSYSPQIHSHLGDYSYELFEKEPEELEDFLRNGDFSGLNVTIPYKKTVIGYLDKLTDRARKMGSVNTIVRRDDQLIGHNTDYFGFETMLDSTYIPVSGKKVLVLGSGGAGSTATTVLKERGANVVVISRSSENNYDNLHMHADAFMIVNATPVGMYPNNEQAPVDLQQFPQLKAVLDVIYNPARTQLLMQAQHMEIAAVNGLLMLVAQAKEAAEWFTGHTIDNSKITQIHRHLQLQMENIVLIGMPGCGKSTIGKQLAARLGKEFVDSDEIIQRLAGKSIPEIFYQDGEAAFRAWETQALREVGKRSGLVIATGGGCVTRLENYPLLHQNGCIYWLKRDLDKLPTNGRPLSQSNPLTALYTARRPLYHAFSDCIVDNNGSIADAVHSLQLLWEGIE